MGSLFDGAQRAWRFARQLSVPLFSAGRLRFELRLAEVRESRAVVAYERAIETAFREVAEGLAEREIFAMQPEAQGRTVASAERHTALMRRCPACVSVRDPGAPRTSRCTAPALCRQAGTAGSAAQRVRQCDGSVQSPGRQPDGCQALRSGAARGVRMATGSGLLRRRQSCAQPTERVTSPNGRPLPAGDH